MCASHEERNACEEPRSATCACRPECTAALLQMSTTTSYATPSIESVAAEDEARTQGGFEVVVKGTNLGTSGITSVHMMQGRSSRSGGGAAIACDSVPRERPVVGELVRADSGRDELRCTAVEGIGVVDVTVNVNGQCASTVFEFAPPRLDQAPRHDARGYLLPTMGGTLICNGANFGSLVSLGVNVELLWSASSAEALHQPL